MTIADFDHLTTDKKKELLQKCCGSSAWVNKMIPVFPVNDLIDLFEYADEKWEECTPEDWLEAFTHHPQIGDKNFTKEKFDSTAEWAAEEQAGVHNVSDSILKSLAEGNKLYLEKFGFIFIVFASEKSADEMLTILLERLKNIKEDEIKTAAAEQIKITKNRLQKLFV